MCIWQRNRLQSNGCAAPGLTLADLDRQWELGLNNPDGKSMESKIIASSYATMLYGDVKIQWWVSILNLLLRPLLSWKHTQQLRIYPDDSPRQIMNIGSSQQCSRRRPQNSQKLISWRTWQVLQGHISSPFQVMPPSILSDLACATSPSSTRPLYIPVPPPSTTSPAEVRQTFLQCSDILITKEDFLLGLRRHWRQLPFLL